MEALISIPYVDIRKGTPLDLLEGHLAGAHALVVAAAGTFGALSRTASLVALPLGDRASLRWLEPNWVARIRGP